MPYRHNVDLPAGVKNHLPPHAQTIYRVAFNNAWVEYKNPKKRLRGGSQEETARRVSWAAVKKKYRKRGDTWVAKKTED
jgi:cation transport regulator